MYIAVTVWKILNYRPFTLLSFHIILQTMHTPQQYVICVIKKLILLHLIRVVFITRVIKFCSINGWCVIKHFWSELVLTQLFGSTFQLASCRKSFWIFHITILLSKLIYHGKWILSKIQITKNGEGVKLIKLQIMLAFKEVILTMR